MNSNSSSLFSLAHDLLTYGLDGSPIYADQFTRLNRDVFAATIYDNGCKQEYIQNVLDRSWEVLPKLSASLLKVRLLTYCYGEIYDEELIQEAHCIINSWDKSSLTLDQIEIMKELKNIEENPYPWEEFTDDFK